MQSYDASNAIKRVQRVPSIQATFRSLNTPRPTPSTFAKARAAAPVLDAIDGLSPNKVGGVGQRLGSEGSLGLEAMLRNLHFHHHDTPRRSPRQSSSPSPLTHSFTTADLSAMSEQQSQDRMDVDDSPSVPSRERIALAPVQPQPRYASDAQMMSPEETDAKMLEIIRQITPPVTAVPKNRLRRSYAFSQLSPAHQLHLASVKGSPLAPHHQINKRRRDELEDEDEEMERRMSAKRLRRRSVHIVHDLC